MKFIKIMFSDIKKCFLLTIMFFVCIILVPCKELTDEDIQKIMRKWLNEK